jgi:GT2 family glycosyltransferase
MTESISILIITYNRPDDLLELLQSIRMQKDVSALKEVLVLNNASSVSYARVEEFASQNPDLKINYIFSDENLGVSRGRNKLMSMATGDQLLVLDDDILFRQTDDLKNIATVFSKPFFKEANTGVITFRVIYHETKEQQKTALPHKQFDEYKDKEVFLTSYFTGCAHVLQKKVLAETGFYPVDFFYGMEEYDLAYRMVKAGYSLGYDNIVTLEHKESPKGRQPDYQKLASQWVNKSKVAYRYLPFIYYLTTMIAWSFEYIKKANGHWGTFFSCWGKALKIPFVEKKNYIGRNAMIYLKKVKGRLRY